MLKKLSPKRLKTKIKKSFSLMEGILPFTEKPSESYFLPKEENRENTSLKAHDLFSLFTADIIKEEVIFTR